MRKVLLYSGGMDSWLIDKFWHPDLRLYIDIAGRYSDAEKKRLPPNVLIVPLALGQFEQDNLIVPLRNLYFLMVASNFGERLCLGATLGDKHLDKNAYFFKQAEKLLCYLWGPQSKQPEGREIAIEQEFVNKSKIDLVRQFKASGGDLCRLANETFSCYSPINGKECLSCKPCFRKFVALSDSGFKYAEESRRKMWQFVRTWIVPRSKNTELQTYYAERPGEGTIAVEVVKGLYAEFGGDIKEDEQK